METYNYDDAPAIPGFGPEGSVTPSLPDGMNGNDVPATPGFGPAGPATPTVPDGGDVPATPGFGPAGDVTPTVPVTPSAPIRPAVPVRPAIPVRPCVNCSGPIIRPSGNVLWTWGVLSPFFSTSSSVAHARFYNAAASREPMDIYLNGRLVVSDLEYMNYTRYLHIVPGYYRLTVYSRTNPNAAILDTGVQFNGNTSYTLTILGMPNDYSVQLISS